jgi:hypothetical protein
MNLRHTLFVVLASASVLLTVGGCGSGHPTPAQTAGAATAPASTAATQVPGVSSASASTQTPTASSQAPGSASRAAGSASGSTPSSQPGRTAASLLAKYYGDLATYGSEAPPDERAAIVAALQSYLAALADGNWGQACAQLNDPLKTRLSAMFAHAKQFHGGGCVQVVGALFGRAPAPARRAQALTQVLSVRVKGNQAFVLYQSAQPTHDAISMLRVANAWKVGALVGSSL